VTLTAADVAQIMRLVEESTFDELSLEMDGLKISLKRGAGADAAAPSAARVASSGPGAPIPIAAQVQSPGARTAQGPREASTSRPATNSATGAPGGANGVAGSTAAPGASGGAQGAAATATNAQTVTSPLLGTFYRAPKPGAAPFVDIGSEVTEDTTVGIVEVMKLMNTVRAGVRGRVTEILAADGALVEHGEPLLRVSK
jgi:acetyl-CoA carboxylase biotin carboxyl carrier protein